MSRGGPNGRLSIFIFHRVLPAEDAYFPYEPGVERFDQIVSFIARQFRVLPFLEAAQRLAAGQLPAAAACITFDDGYADNFELAVPILRKHGVTGTFFIATAYVDGGRMWNDVVSDAVRLAPAGTIDWRDLGVSPVVVGDVASRFAAYRQMQQQLKYVGQRQRTEWTDEIAKRAGLPETSALMMTRAQVRALPALGMDVGGHTQTHPILARVDDAVARDEIGGGREVLTDWLGFAPQVFAYPNGRPGTDYLPRDVALVRSAGYCAAVSTAPGVGTPCTDPLQLPRYTPGDRAMWKFALRSARNLMQPVA